ncbi:MAG TPA: hypothetical protein VHZ03_41315 [Trebonia sp.]|jgi:hypothetical protein|nr:hypothetical protein [Trebonia sp.]
MSFGFTAIGAKEEVSAQLEHAQITTGEERFNEFGIELRDLIAKHFGHETAHAGQGHEYRYVVKANGHGGGTSPLTVNLVIEPHWVAVPPQEPEVLAAIPDEED